MSRNGSATATAPELPNNIHAERAVLGAIILNNSALDIVSDIVIPEDFYRAHHTILYRAMLAVHEDEKPVDLASIYDFLGDQKCRELPGGIPYISSLIDGLPDVSNVLHHAEIVASKARLRKILKEAEFLQRRILEGGADDAEQLEQQLRDAVEHKGEAITHANGNGNGHRISYSTMDFLKKDWPEPEYLVEGFLARNAPAMIVAMPHSLKSFFTIGLAYAASVPTEKALGRLVVRKPVRTMLIQVEEPGAEMKKRISAFLATTQFLNADPSNVRIVPREEFPQGGFTPKWAKQIVKEALEFKTDLIVFDVLRRLFIGHGDMNGPQDSARFLEMIDAIRDVTGASTLLVHHKNKKDAEMMYSAAGSINFSGWAKTFIEFKNKRMLPGGKSSVEIETDTAYGISADPMRMILDLTSPMPVLLESIEDGDGLSEALHQMDTEWNIRTLMEVMEIKRTSAQRRIKEWEKQGHIRKVSGGKKGRGGLAMYTADQVS
jgi:RecA-family ATPase